MVTIWSVAVSTEAEVATGPDPATPAQSALAWEQQKWRDEYQLKIRELDLKQKEQERSTWSNPLVLAILAAAIAGLSNAVIAMINGRLQRQIEQSKAADSLRIEESRSEAGRILEMIKTGEPDKAASNLKFLVDTGLISNKERVAQIQGYLSTRQPGTGPFLPAADARYTFEQSEGLTKPLAETLEKSLNDFIAYLDRLGLKREQEKISIDIVKGDDALYPYYDPSKTALVINQLIVGDHDVPRRAYTHHVLKAGHGVTVGPNLNALVSGLAWYLPCSFADRPIYGEFMGRAMKLDRPIGDISQRFDYKPFKRDEARYLYVGGEAWASLFWEIRTRLGQQVADALVIQAWQKTSASSGEATDCSFANRFDQELLENVPEEARSVISTILKDRGFPL
jgi:hypothetical protein